MKKVYVQIIILSLIMLSAVTYAFIQAGSPQSARAARLDNTRITDITTIKSYVDNYYASNYLLPQTLSEALKNYDYVKQNDPVTNEPYSYSVVNPTTYKVCATFEGESKQYGQYTRLSYMEQDLTHPEGYYCFEFKVTPRNDVTILDGRTSPGSSGVYGSPVQQATPGAVPFVQGQ